MGKIYSKEGNGYLAMPVASLVLGIISIFSIIFWYMSLITGILAIIFGVKSIHRTNSKLGKAGMILGIVGISLCIFLYLGFMFLMVVTSL